MSDRRIVFTEPQTVTVEPVAVESPGPNELLVETTWSGISPGTEMLVYQGAVPDEMAADVTLPTLDGDLSYPTAYGYASVGTVAEVGSEVSPAWLDRSVFVFHPHQTRFCTTVEDVVPVPDQVSPRHMTLLPTVETATNFLLDGQPRIGERVVVFGAGVVGLATTRLLAEHPVDELVVVEPLPARRELALELGADRAVTPDRVSSLFTDRTPAGADLIYELSGHPEALDDAVDVAGYGGRIVVGSWYGTKRAPLDLGSSFHRERISITSSQVSTIAPADRGRWSKSRRLDVAKRQLPSLPFDRLVTDVVPFDDAPTAYRRIDQHPADTVQVLLQYE